MVVIFNCNFSQIHCINHLIFLLLSPKSPLDKTTMNNTEVPSTDNQIPNNNPDKQLANNIPDFEAPNGVNEIIPEGDDNDVGGEIVTPNENIDFSQATRNADGKLCVLKEEIIETVVKEPLLQCTHKKLQKCHYTYITKFSPIQEEVSK